MGKKAGCLLIVILVLPLFFHSGIAVKSNKDTVTDTVTISSEQYEKGYRYNTHGWIYLHIKGDPYERGYQHGYLLSKEIVDHIQRWIHIFPQKYSWKIQRFNANRLFWNKYPEEYKQEIKGIADGCADRGGEISGRPVDYKDILALNEMYEMLTRFRNYDIYPLRLSSNWLVSGLLHMLKSKLNLKTSAISKGTMKGSCSAFIATGDATVDGRIVASHNTRSFAIEDIWWHMYVTERWNLMLDIDPSDGYRVFISTAPGMIWSDEDYYQNDAGMILMETTLPLGIWNRFGDPLVVRARKAIQYSDNIDEMVDFFVTRNNGLFADEWIMGDTKTGEIATLELGLFNHAVKRTKNGFYWSVNAPRDDKVRWELLSIFGLGLLGRLIEWEYEPRPRDIKFEEYKEQYYGKIDVDIARRIMSTYPICDVLGDDIIMYDCKVTDSQLVENFGLWTFMGNPGDVDFQADEYPLREERDEYTDSPACGWVQIFGRDPSSSHIDLDPRRQLRNTGDKLWEFKTEEGEIGNAIYSSPASDKERLYFSSWNGKIYCSDLETGEKIWDKKIGWSSESTPTVVDDSVIVGSSDGLFVLNKDNGEVTWKAEIGTVSTKSLYHDDLVYCGSHDGKVYALDFKTGGIQWIFETNYEIHCPPTIDEGLLYIGSNNGCMYALDSKTGSQSWVYETGNPVWSSPVVYDNKLFFGSWDSNVYALDSRDGDLVWRFTTGWGVDSSPAVHNNVVFLGSEDNNFYALDANDGSLKWVYPTKAGIRSAPVVYGGLVFFGSSDGRFYALDEENGGLNWSVAPDYHIEGVFNYLTKPFVSSPFIIEGKVYVGSTNGNVYSFDAKTYEKPVSEVEKVIFIPVETWLFMVISIILVVLVTAVYLYWFRRERL